MPVEGNYPEGSGKLKLNGYQDYLLKGAQEVGKQALPWPSVLDPLIARIRAKMYGTDPEYQMLQTKNDREQDYPGYYSEVAGVANPAHQQVSEEQAIAMAANMAAGGGGGKGPKGGKVIKFPKQPEPHLEAAFKLPNGEVVNVGQWHDIGNLPGGGEGIDLEKLVSGWADNKRFWPKNKTGVIDPEAFEPIQSPPGTREVGHVNELGGFHVPPVDEIMKGKLGKFFQRESASIGELPMPESGLPDIPEILPDRQGLYSYEQHPLAANQPMGQSGGMHDIPDDVLQSLLDQYPVKPANEPMRPPPKKGK